MRIFNKNTTPWWQTPEVRTSLSAAVQAFEQYKDDTAEHHLERFDLQFEALHHLIVAYNKFHFNNQADQYYCICSLIDQGIPENRKQIIIAAIKSIGMEQIRSAFVVLNQVCEERIKEPGDLFSIIKKHRLNQVYSASEQEMFTRLGYYLNVSMINFNRKRNKGKMQESKKLIKMKTKASLQLIPLMDSIFEALMGDDLKLYRTSALRLRNRQSCDK